MSERLEDWVEELVAHHQEQRSDISEQAWDELRGFLLEGMARQGAAIWLGTREATEALTRIIAANPPEGPMVTNEWSLLILESLADVADG